MRRLISVNWTYLVRCKYFWTGGAVMLLWAGGECAAIKQLINQDYEGSLDNALLRGALALLVVLPALGGLVVNVDYHDGVIRNKLLAGCSRAAVYLSNLCTVYLMGLCFLGIYEAVCLGLGSGLGIGIENPESVAVRLGVLLLTVLALSALITLAAMMVTGRWVLVLCALLGLGLLFGGKAVNGLLENAPTTPDWDQIWDIRVELDENGEMVNRFIGMDGEVIPEDQVPMRENPGYIREPLRNCLRAFNDAQPGGQVFELVERGHGSFDEMQNYSMEETPHWQLAAWSLLLTGLATLAGLGGFLQKEIK